MRKMIPGVKPGPTKKTEPTQDGSEPERWLINNRAMRRAMRRTANTGMHNPFKRRYKTGPNRHLQSWRAESRVISALKQIDTGSLAASVADEDAKAATALALLAPRFPNIWEIARADRADLLAVKGFGRVRLRHLATFLASRNVPLSWAESSDPGGTVASGEEGKSGN